MSTATYALPSSPNFLSHGLNRDIPLWLADRDEVRYGDIIRENADPVRRDFTADDAMAASGDCFVTVATRLDKLAQGLPIDSAEQIELEHIVRSLLYLQDHYTVIAKHKVGR